MDPVSAQRLAALPPYLFAEIDRKRDQARAAGRDVIDLGVGDPDLPTPSFIIERMREALGDPTTHRYPPEAGLPPLREQIAAWFRTRFDVALDPTTEILVLIGSKEGLGHLPLAVVDPGRTVLVPDPGYPVYHAASVFAGSLPVVVPSGSCAAMNFHGNLLQFEHQPDEAVTSLASRTWELFDYIVNGLGVRTWPGALPEPTRVALHHSCHTRGSGTREAATLLLGSIGNLQLVPFGQGEQCCGFGGTFSVTFPHISARMGSLKLDHALEPRPDLLSSADMSCLMHLAGLAESQDRKVPCKHAVQILRDALDNL